MKDEGVGSRRDYGRRRVSELELEKEAAAPVVAVEVQE